MRITLRLFAVLRERAGTDLLPIDVPEGSTAAQAFAASALAPGLPVGFAVNERMVAGAEVLQAGDELALLPPLGGG